MCSFSDAKARTFSSRIEELEDSLCTLESQTFGSISLGKQIDPNFASCSKEYMRAWRQKTIDLDDLFSKELLDAFEQGSIDHFERFVQEDYVPKKKLALLSSIYGDAVLASQSIKGQYFASLEEIQPVLTKYSLNHQLPRLQHMVQALAARFFDFGPSSWSKRSTIQQLILELRSYGPLIVPGSLGRHLYSDTTTQSADTQSVTGVTLYMLRDRKPNLDREHVVIVVGAAVLVDDASKQYVFFADPNDQSKVDGSIENKIYKISYKSLCDHTEEFSMIGSGVNALRVRR